MFIEMNGLLEPIYITVGKTQLTIYCTVQSSYFALFRIFKWFPTVWLLKHSTLDDNSLELVQWRRLDILVFFCHREIGFCVHSCFLQTINKLLEYMISFQRFKQYHTIIDCPGTCFVINPFPSMSIDFIHCSAWLKLKSENSKILSGFVFVMYSH